MVKHELPPALRISPPAVCRQIESFLQQRCESLKRDGAVVPLSGGLDSAVAAALTVHALGAARVHLLNLPERDSDPLHQGHARRFAAQLGVPLARRRITAALRSLGAYRLLPLGWIPLRSLRARLVNFGKARFLRGSDRALLAERLQPEAGSWVARGGAYGVAKHRMRMLAVYLYAEPRNLMVVGAANRTEWLTGTFSKWGVDHCADVMPLLHLFRSQVEALAAYLEIPGYIRAKAADPDIIPGVNDKGALLGDFIMADQILAALERGATLDELRQRFGEEQVGRLATLFERSRHMRESPYHLL